MFTRSRLLAPALLVAAAGFASAAVTCTPSGAAVPVRSEGLTEVMGDIVLTCTGNSTDVLRGNLTIFLPVNVTNRLNEATGTLDAVVITNNVPSIPEGVSSTPVGATGMSFNNLNIPLSGGPVTLRVTNLRGAVAQYSSTNPIMAVVSFTGTAGATITNPNVAVGLPMHGLTAGANAGAINCFGSPLPETITFSNLLAAGTRVSSNRVSEGFPAAFEPRRAGTDSGVRFLVRFAGIPQGVRLFVPDVIAGSDALQPTAGGDLPATPSGGRYQPSAAGSLLLARVAFADANGAAGAPVYAPGPAGSAAVAFDAISEVPLNAGAGSVTYEVMDANPNVQESAQLPTFLGVPAALASGANSAGVGTETLFLAPVSTAATATAGPIPRFLAVTPAPDCIQSGDCAVFPRLQVQVWPNYPLTFTAEAGGKRQSGFASVVNTGGGNLAWNLTLTYQSGSGWIDNIYSEPNRGPFSGWFRVDVNPGSLAPGAYQATITVDGGWAAGSQSVPVTLTVTKPAPPVAQVTAVVHAATFAPGPVVPGSLTTLMGTHLRGTAVSVTFDGIAARLLYTSDTQINLVVPAELVGRTTAQLVVTVDGAGSTPRAVEVTALAPAVFSNGILNQDNFVNTPVNPAPVGSVIQIFATGLSSASTITARLHDRDFAVPDYAGPAPGLFGVQQVNLRVPADLPAMTTDVVLCGTSATTGQKVCGPPARVSLRQ